MVFYATLTQLRAHLGLDAADTAEDTRLIAALEAASAAIERHTRRTFQPRLASIPHDVNLRDVTELLLVDDLLELTSLTNGDGTNIPLADSVQIADAILRLTNGNAFTYDDSPERAITVTGYWGFHPNGSMAWIDSGDTVQDSSLSASATMITVTDVDAGEPQRFQVGQLLRIEDEYATVTGIDTGTNTLTVQRGVRGTVAATHNNGTAIEIYQMPPDIVHLTLRWALWLYREPDSFNTSLPPMLQQSLAGLRRFTVRS